MLDALFINGHWQKPVEPGTIDIFNPCTEEVYHIVANAGSADVDGAVAAARAALPGWNGAGGAVCGRFLKSIDGDGAEAMLRAFMRPPVFQTSYDQGYGTLYAAAYYSAIVSAELIWPGLRWQQSCADFSEGSRNFRFNDEPGSSLHAVTGQSQGGHT